MKSTYSTAELASLLNVNESTVKRWSDAGDLACVKTKGGHRRFAVASVMEFIKKHGLSASIVNIDALADEDVRAHVVAGNIHKLVPELKKEMMAGNVGGILRVLRIAHVARPKLLDLYSNLVFPPLAAVGEEWHAGTVSIDQEHLASNALREALSRFHAELPRKESNGLKAICSCFEGELHDIVIQCVGFYLGTEGWHVLFLGQSTPTKSLVEAIKSHKPNLVAVSSLAPRRERSLMNAVNNHIYPVSRRVKARLVLGGPGIKERWTGKVKAEFLCDTIAETEVFANPNAYATHN